MKNILSFCHKKCFGLLILRVFVGAIFIIHGVQKFEHADSMISFFNQIGLSAFWMYLTASVEVISGVALVLGVFTRIAAFSLVVIGVCAIYFFKWKVGAGSWLSEFAASELDLALLGANLALIFTGAGLLAMTRYCKCKCHKGDGLCTMCVIADCAPCQGKCAGKCEVKCDASCNHVCPPEGCDHPHHSH